MSVRAGLLAVLTLGPAYGAQLHAELVDRLGHRRSVNIGQVYSTLERLSVQGLVRAAGVTTDGLPLYRASKAGLSEADGWLTDAPPADPDWAEMLDAVLMATSLPGRDVRPLIASYHERWRGAEASGNPGPQDRLADRADRLLQRAAIDWLDETLSDFEVAVRSGTTESLTRGVTAERPRRGRRPSTPETRHLASA